MDNALVSAVDPDLRHDDACLQQILCAYAPRQDQSAVIRLYRERRRGYPIVVESQKQRVYALLIRRVGHTKLFCDTLVVACESDEPFFFRDDHFSRLDGNHIYTSNHGEKKKKVAYFYATFVKYERIKLRMMKQAVCYTMSASSRIRRSVFSHPRQGSVIDFP